MKEKSEKQAGVWTKAQIMASSKYAHQADVLQAVLKDGELYTVDQVDSLVDDYLKGGVD